MPLADAITFTQRSADERLGRAIDELVRRFDVALPDLPAPIVGTYPGAARAERALALAIRAEAIVDAIKRPLAK